MSEEKKIEAPYINKSFVGPHFNQGLGKHVDNYSDLKVKMKVAGLEFEDGGAISKEWSDKAFQTYQDKQRARRTRGKVIYSFPKR